MQEDIKKILIRYWGFSQFRPLQEDIIQAVLQGDDVLALLPTGGGKSLCFQVPALAREGICLVVSPLIALMKDQVENLQRKGIAATALHSGMHYREIDLALNNCMHGPMKFLYLSPERLSSANIQERLPHMPISLIAVDEAHCVSQWGYDFRPSYLDIASVRTLVPQAPLLALTATATPRVQEDIQEKLAFRKKFILRSSFERKNLAYVVLHEEDKSGKSLRILRKLKGQGILYVRSRRKAVETSERLNREGISAAFYHAGMAMEERSRIQDAWMKNGFRVIVATNAFGMGIDKSDVRFVLHDDLPDCLEAYFQEAGRAGRDGQKAHAILLFNNNDKVDLERRAEENFPETAEIRRTYQALANFFQLPAGSGRGVTFDFDIALFCNTYTLTVSTAWHCLKVLELQGLIRMDDTPEQHARIRILLRHDSLYEFQVKNVRFDHLLKVLLRSYEGLFDGYVQIRETEIARRAEMQAAEVVSLLGTLHRNQVLEYLPASRLPRLTFLTERLGTSDLSIDRQHLGFRKERFRERLDAILDYATKTSRCRSQLLLHYFGEDTDHRCGVCDFCLRRNRLGLSDLEFSEVHAEVKTLLQQHSLPLSNLVESVHSQQEDKTLKVVEWLIDNRKIEVEGPLLRWTD